ncbi:MAG TPA: flagellar protein FlbB [Pseudolabrys sp.]|jgi:flagellar motility protein MotE (MotC chaperone)
MIRRARDFRLIPVVLLATICLFALKVSGLVFDGGYTLAERLQGLDKNQMQVTTRESVPDYPKIIVADQQTPLPAASAPVSQRSWAGQALNYGSRDITGSIEGGESKASDAAPKVSTKPPEPTKLEVGNVSVPMETGHLASAGERAVLDRLQERRKELDTRGRELEMRESLLKATEKRLDAKVAEIKDVEARVNTAVGNRDKADAQRFKSIVAMYENMKAKDAARIFERLDMKILVEVATQIKPAKMSEILAQMPPEAAEKLTVELARRSDGKSQNPEQLPKIEGKPSGG